MVNHQQAVSLFAVYAWNSMKCHAVKIQVFYRCHYYHNRFECYIKKRREVCRKKNIGILFTVWLSHVCIVFGFGFRTKYKRFLRIWKFNFNSRTLSSRLDIAKMLSRVQWVHGWCYLYHVVISASFFSYYKVSAFYKHIKQPKYGLELEFCFWIAFASSANRIHVKRIRIQLRVYKNQ